METIQLCKPEGNEIAPQRRFIVAPTSEEVDKAIIVCLQIFAARGRELRLARERQSTSANSPLKETLNVKLTDESVNSIHSSPRTDKG